MKSRPRLALIFLLWSGLWLAIFFDVQKPDALQVAGGLADTLANVGLAVLFTIAGTTLGYLILGRLHLEMEAAVRLMLATGTGMGILGLLGFGLAVLDLARPAAFLILLLGLPSVALLSGALAAAYADSKVLISDLRSSAEAAPRWVPVFSSLILILAFLLALAPPIEAFDAMFYHLVVPAWWLRDGGLRMADMPHYWYPSLMEGMFVWPLAFGKDSAPQLIHLVFGLLSVLLAREWTRTLWGEKAGWWSLAIFVSMPSLPWLAAWAYTDLGLVFYSLAVLYSLWKWRLTNRAGWLILSGSFLGFAMGIKYTSVVLLVTVLGLLAWWERKNIRTLAAQGLQLVVPCLLMSFAWYLRNWAWMHNPFYPFIFGGPFWDSFRSAWYANVGTGLGWNPLNILSLPVVTTLGYRDANFYDGRIGPLFLILSPLMAWIFWRARRAGPAQQAALGIILPFSLLSSLAWTYGAVQTASLLQARLLWPGIIPLILPASAGILELERLETDKLRAGFVFSGLMGLTVFVFMLNFSLQVIQRNPVAVAVGMQTRDSYYSREQPAYADLLGLIRLQTRQDAYIYLIGEPRSYGMDRRVQPDAINDNLAHDFYIYPTNAALISAWRSLGYTHVVIARKALELDLPGLEIYKNPEFIAREIDLEGRLTLLGQTPAGYLLYSLPQE
jgi:hypothetical protein